MPCAGAAAVTARDTLVVSQPSDVIVMLLSL
jgi:hypothetical protein